MPRLAQSQFIAGGGADVDPHFSKTILLINADGTNGANTPINQINEGTYQVGFTPISVPSETSQGIVSPKSISGHSIRFDKSGAGSIIYSTPTSSNLSLELWFFYEGQGDAATQASNHPVWSCGGKSAYGTTAEFGIDKVSPTSATTTAYVYFGENGSASSPKVSKSFTINLNEWYHVLATRVGAETHLYLNGVDQGAWTVSNGWNASSGALGGSSYFNEYATNFYTAGGFRGYLSNFRIINNQAIVNGNFTPSKRPLTIDTIGHTGSNVATSLTGNCGILLFNTGDVLVDKSAYRRQASGAPSNLSSSTFTAFTPEDPYDNTINYGSAIALGTQYGFGSYAGSAFSTSNVAVWTTSTDFTFEFMLNLLDWPYDAQQSIEWTNNNYSFYRTTYLKFNNDGSITLYGQGYNVTPYNITTSSGHIKLNVWQHVALSRTSGTLRFFVDGFQIHSEANSEGFPWPDAIVSFYLLGSGNPATGSYYGRTKGMMTKIKYNPNEGLYNSTFLPNVDDESNSLSSNTRLYIDFNSDNPGSNLIQLIDSTQGNHLFTRGDCRISTANKKYGTGSLIFDGTGDYIVTTEMPSNVLAAGNFTIEFWYYFTGSTGSDIIVLDQRPVSTNGYYPTIYIKSTGALAYYVNGSDRIVANNVVGNTWTHLAVVRNSGNTNIYINGTKSGATYADTNDYLVGRFVMGGSGYTLGNSLYTGNLDDIRITKGVARYTANTLPPGPAPIQ